MRCLREKGLSERFMNTPGYLLKMANYVLVWKTSVFGPSATAFCGVEG